MDEFKTDCVRKKSNISTVYNGYKMDNINFNPTNFLEDAKTISPKLIALMDNITKLDNRDKTKFGKCFKHFIFSDIKSGYGAKMLASGLISNGWQLGYKSKLKNKEWGSLKMLSSQELKLYDSFYLLSSIPVYDNEISVKMKKNILANFNSRPENIYGNLARIIIMDSGFKEGIDLFDIKYIHIFEPPTNYADQKQVIGRGTRTCGQKGLEFDNVYGWPLDVFVYDLEIPLKLQKSLLGSKTSQELMLKSMNIDSRLANFEYDIERLAVLGSVDYELNLKVHNFKVDLSDENEDKIILGGEISTKPSFSKLSKLSKLSTLPLSKEMSSLTLSKGIVSTLPLSKEMSSLTLSKGLSSTLPLSKEMSSLTLSKGLSTLPLSKEMSQSNEDIPVGHYNMNKYINHFFGKYRWNNVKMENLCGDIPQEWKDHEIINKERKQYVPYDNDDDEENNEDDEEEEENDEDDDDEEEEEDDEDDNDEENEENEDEDENDDEEENDEDDQIGGGNSSVLKFTPTQSFIQHYFTPKSPVKGMLLYHSVGTGKTCSAIAAATTNFDPNGYTILWVTRTTLKNDIWKNMFDQVCHKTIQSRIKDGETIPDIQNERIKLLSRNWRIRPLSYKQFSNLVSKKNKYYDQLVKENGAADPLRKTLLIIDEAHKLYGGGDLSSIERPDMNALHAALMNSYSVSGSNSVRLLLMTATPITKHGMELVQLINLCKPIEYQLPSGFEHFAKDYLKEDGHFRKEGSNYFLDQIAGHISYLNREKDARQFSQPRIHKIMVPIISTDILNNITDFDKYVIRTDTEDDIIKLETELEQNIKTMEDELKDISKYHFDYFFDRCDTSDKKCKTIVKKNITLIMKTVKLYILEIKTHIKQIKTELINIKKSNKHKISLIAHNIETNPKLYNLYKQSSYVSLKKCSFKTLNGLLNTKLYPEIIEVDKKIQASTDTIILLKKQLQIHIREFKEQIGKLKNTPEKNILRDTKKNMKLDIQQQIKSEVKNKKQEEQNKKKILVGIHSTIKQNKKKDIRNTKQTQRNERKLRNTIDKQKLILKEINNERIKELVIQQQTIIDNELMELQQQNELKLNEKQQKKAEKTRKDQLKKANKELKQNTDKTRKKK